MKFEKRSSGEGDMPPVQEEGLSHGFLTSTASVSGSLLVHVRKSGDSDEFGHIPGDAVLQAGNCRT